MQDQRNTWKDEVLYNEIFPQQRFQPPFFNENYLLNVRNQKSCCSSERRIEPFSLDSQISNINSLSHTKCCFQATKLKSQIQSLKKQNLLYRQRYEEEKKHSIQIENYYQSRQTLWKKKLIQLSLKKNQYEQIINKQKEQIQQKIKEQITKSQKKEEEKYFSTQIKQFTLKEKKKKINQNILSKKKIGYNIEQKNRHKDFPILEQVFQVARSKSTIQQIIAWPEMKKLKSSKIQNDQLSKVLKRMLNLSQLQQLEVNDYICEQAGAKSGQKVYQYLLKKFDKKQNNNSQSQKNLSVPKGIIKKSNKKSAITIKSPRQKKQAIYKKEENKFTLCQNSADSLRYKRASQVEVKPKTLVESIFNTVREQSQQFTIEVSEVKDLGDILAQSRHYLQN